MFDLINLLLLLLLLAFIFFGYNYVTKMKVSIGFFRLFWEQLFLEPLLFIFRWLPGAYGMFCRNIIYAFLLKKKGKNVLIREGVKFFFPERIVIGDYSGVHEECKLDGSGGITIGKYVRLAPRVEIMTSNHIYNDLKTPLKLQGLEYKSVIIEDDVWIGIGALLVPGVHIGKGSIIGGHSVVTKDIPDYAIVVGNPAKIISYRK